MITYLLPLHFGRYYLANHFIASIKFLVENTSELIKRHIPLRQEGVFYNRRLMSDSVHGRWLVRFHVNLRFCFVGSFLVIIYMMAHTPFRGGHVTCLLAGASRAATCHARTPIPTLRLRLVWG